MFEEDIAQSEQVLDQNSTKPVPEEAPHRKNVLDEVLCDIVGPRVKTTETMEKNPKEEESESESEKESSESSSEDEQKGYYLKTLIKKHFTKGKLPGRMKWSEIKEKIDTKHKFIHYLDREEK